MHEKSKEIMCQLFAFIPGFDKQIVSFKVLKIRSLQSRIKQIKAELSRIHITSLRIIFQDQEFLSKLTQALDF